MSGPGFAVVDVETTGFGGRDRIVEVAVVSLDPVGRAVGEWSTLVDPRRDVGPTSVHGLRPRDLVDAPRFADIAADLAGILQGRVPVAHNLPFDARFLQAEYTRAGCPQVPLAPEQGVCTMRLATQYLPYAPRGLAGCCAAAGVPVDGAHEALCDARAAAGLLSHYLSRTDGTEEWPELLRLAADRAWPPVPRERTGRGRLTRDLLADRRAASVTGPGPGHFLSRLLPALPRVPEPPAADSYLAALDDALADRKIDRWEADALVELAHDLGLGREAAEDLHRNYLLSLARAAWEDGIIEDHERRDLDEVAVLLALPPSAVDRALAEGEVFTGGSVVPTGSLRLRPGDRVCFTGQMNTGRDELTALASRAGLRVMGNVSRRTVVLVCADADSMSGKARKARDIGTKVISEPKFHHLLALLTAQEPV
jgi:DNA polymerase III subunit epsilon